MRRRGGHDDLLLRENRRRLGLAEPIRQLKTIMCHFRVLERLLNEAKLERLLESAQRVAILLQGFEVPLWPLARRRRFLDWLCRLLRALTDRRWDCLLVKVEEVVDVVKLRGVLRRAYHFLLLFLTFLLFLRDLLLIPCLLGSIRLLFFLKPLRILRFPLDFDSAAATGRQVVLLIEFGLEQ